MTNLCVTRIPREPMLATGHGVLRASALNMTSDARDAASRILEQARQEAERIAASAHEQARLAVQEAEQRTLERAATLLAALEEQNRQFSLGVQNMLADMALVLFERLVGELSAQDRVAASCRLLAQEAPRQLLRPVLWLHPDDGPLAPPLEWEIRTDPSLRAGGCRLEAADGEWRFDFDEGMAALTAAFKAEFQAAAPSIPA
jgi:flagellar biosynthesis/type III secretory pathway protein FliH